MILSVGSIAFDSVQTPAGKREKVLGGALNYFSLAASYFSKVAMVGVVGDDYPQEHFRWLETRGVDVSGVTTEKGHSFHWVGSYGDNLNEATTLSTQLNVFESFNPTIQTAHQTSPYVFLANIHPAIQLKVLEQVKNPLLVACDTMNFWITGTPDELKETLKRVDILSINEAEALMLSGAKSLRSASEKIFELGPQTLVIKRGEYGAIVFTPSAITLIPAYLVRDVVDPTGAGDSFAGAMMGRLAEANATKSIAKDSPQRWQSLMARAVASGCVMASFTVEDFSFDRLKRLDQHALMEREESFRMMLAVR